MITRSISWEGKGGRCVGLTTFPHSCADCPEMWEPQTPGIPGPVQDSTDIALPVPLPLLLPYFLPLPLLYFSETLISV